VISLGSKSSAVILAIALLIFLAIKPSASSQAAGSTDVRVEISTDKKTYTRGELVRFRAVLINKGSAPFYISKFFSYSSSDMNGANTPGFEIRIRQVSGMGMRLPGCMSVGDYLSPSDHRTPEQILKEDFVRLPPGGLVGFEDDLNHFPPIGCVKPYQSVGKYEVAAVYSTKDRDRERVTSVLGGERLLDGRYESAPTTFTIR
jgi:hypothetical protein